MEKRELSCKEKKKYRLLCTGSNTRVRWNMSEPAGVKEKEDEGDMDEKDDTNKPNEVTVQLSKRMTRGKRGWRRFKKELRMGCTLNKEWKLTVRRLGKWSERKWAEEERKARKKGEVKVGSQKDRSTKLEMVRKGEIGPDSAHLDGSLLS